MLPADSALHPRDCKTRDGQFLFSFNSFPVFNTLPFNPMPSSSKSCPFLSCSFWDKRALSTSLNKQYLSYFWVSSTSLCAFPTHNYCPNSHKAKQKSGTSSCLGNLSAGVKIQQTPGSIHFVPTRWGKKAIFWFKNSPGAPCSTLSRPWVGKGVRNV